MNEKWEARWERLSMCECRLGDGKDLEGRGQACRAGQEGGVTTAENSPPHHTLILKAPLPRPWGAPQRAHCCSQLLGSLASLSNWPECIPDV